MTALKSTAIVATGVLLAAAGPSALAEASLTTSLQSCTAAAAQVLTSPRPDPAWFAPVADADRQLRIELSGTSGEWEFQCDPRAGALTSAEWTGNDPATSPLAQGLAVPQEEAIERARSKIPGGVIDEVSHRMTAGGQVSYEFDVRAPDGTLHEVDVDGRTGEVMSTAIEKDSPVS